MEVGVMVGKTRQCNQIRVDQQLVARCILGGILTAKNTSEQYISIYELIRYTYLVISSYRPY